MSQGTILIIDDDESLVRFAARALRRLDYKVLTALNGPQAMMMCDRHPDEIDVVLADVVMPGMKGEDLQRYLKGKRPYSRIVFMSGYPEEILSEHGITRERVLFLKKPFSVDLLQQTVVSAMGLS